MQTSYRALCSDSYVNLRVNLRMDLSMRRDTVLALFERIRRERPDMDRFRRYQNELALESRGEVADGHEWLAIRRTSVRSGSVNPQDENDAYSLHRLVLEAAPYFLDLSPLDVDHLELLYGFDLMAVGNHDQIVSEALLAGSPLGGLALGDGVTTLDCQPVYGVLLEDEHELGATEVFVEVKTRMGPREIREGACREEPISVYLTLRRSGPFESIKVFQEVFNGLAQRGESVLENSVIPGVLMPIREAISHGV